MKKLLCRAALTCLVAASAIASETTKYEYNALGRLTDMQVLDGARSGVEQHFHFDAAGNRTGIQTVGPSNARPAALSAGSPVVNLSGASGSLAVNVGGTTPAGSVSFWIGDLFVDSAPVVNGSARIALRGFAPGIYTVMARYSGDATRDPTSISFTVKVQDLSWLPAVLDLILG